VGEAYECDASSVVVRTSGFAGVLTVDFTWIGGGAGRAEHADIRVFNGGSLDVLACGGEYDCGDDRHPASVAHGEEIGPSDAEINVRILCSTKS